MDLARAHDQWLAEYHRPSVVSLAFLSFFAHQDGVDFSSSSSAAVALHVMEKQK